MDYMVGGTGHVLRYTVHERAFFCFCFSSQLFFSLLLSPSFEPFESGSSLPLPHHPRQHLRYRVAALSFKKKKKKIKKVMVKIAGLLSRWKSNGIIRQKSIRTPYNKAIFTRSKQKKKKQTKKKKIEYRTLFRFFWSKRFVDNKPSFPIIQNLLRFFFSYLYFIFLFFF